MRSIRREDLLSIIALIIISIFALSVMEIGTFLYDPIGYTIALFSK